MNDRDDKERVKERERRLSGRRKREKERTREMMMMIRRMTVRLPDTSQLCEVKQCLAETALSEAEHVAPESRQGA
jgi:hypothetical protein